MSTPEDIKTLGPEHTGLRLLWYIVDATIDGDETGHILHQAKTQKQAEIIAQKVRDHINEYNLWRDDNEGQWFIEEEIL